MTASPAPLAAIRPAAREGALLVGYASLFGVPDLAGDVVEPGAFRASLARRGAEGVRMLWQHDPAEPVGRWLSLVEDARGLRVAGRLNPAVQRARELDALVRGGAVDGLSIGFRVLTASGGRGTRGRRLLSVDLWEVSLVTFPMLPGARLEHAGATPSTLAPSTLAAAIRRAAATLSPHHTERTS